MAIRTKITLFNAALLRTGNSEISDGDGSELWRALEGNYDEIVRAAFEEGNGSYPFGKARVTLTGRSDGTFGYSDAYQIPADALHILEVYLDGCSLSDRAQPWELAGDGDKLVLDAGTAKVEIEYVKSGDEHRWSSSFAQGIQKKLEAVIKDAEEEFQEAMTLDEVGDFALLKASTKASRNRSNNDFWKRGGGRLLRRRRTKRY